MSAHVLLNLLNEFGKNKMRDCDEHLVGFRNPLETLYLISINFFLILTFMQTLPSHEIAKIPNICILQQVI